MRLKTIFVLMPLSLGLVLVVSESSIAARESVSMRTIEGKVLSFGYHQGEGGLQLLLARVQVPDGPESGTEILLAPEAILDQIGFRVEEGDRLRARIFVSIDGPSRVQKIQNFTQGTMVRMRTLHSIPLWSTEGAWQGGPIRTARGRDRVGRGVGKGPHG